MFLDPDVVRVLGHGCEDGRHAPAARDARGAVAGVVGEVRERPGASVLYVCRPDVCLTQCRASALERRIKDR
jgi:hypothetical protein